ncbi:MAG TPA: histidinol-phosphatase [Stellaceae bacterium]|jgi:inositol-phosphate phosphatase/L-galactose 1-phosphate phosphatase/histidinol-phosphatase|nr:histidinol-phosphatase [Stellaceae bacterium]
MTDAVDAAHLALAAALADAAGRIIRGHFRQPLAVDDKSDQSPVTLADRAAEAAMRELIEGRFPEHGIIGEEHGSVRAEAEHVWVLDPIDGTKSFISGIPLFGTLIALTRRGRPVLGVIDQAILGERWLGAVGRVTTLNGAPVRTRACPSLGGASLFSTAPELMFHGADAAGFERLRAAIKLFRAGGDCYAYAQLASGRIDLVVEAQLKPYDYCALAPVIAGAGGSITDWQGRALDLASDGRVLACGDPALAAPARALLAGG